MCGRAYVPLDIAAGPELRGAVRERNLGEVNISQVGSTPLRIVRSRELVRSDPRESLIFSILRTGGGTVLQHGRPAEVRPGGGYLLGSDHPYTVRFPVKYDMLAVRIPTRLSSIDSRTSLGLAGRAIAPDNDDLRVLRDHLAWLLTSDATDDQMTAAREQGVVVELLDQLGRRMAHERDGLGRLSGQARVAYARSFLLQNYADPELSIDDVARHHAISRRHFEKQFARHGVGPSEYLRDLRLQQATTLLLAEPPLTIHAIAGRSGFGNVNTFIRAFRRRHDVTPDEWRRTVLAAAAGADG